MPSERSPYVDETGVVDPLRVPPAARGVLDAVGRLPRLAQVFVALAVVELGLDLATRSVSPDATAWLSALGRAAMVALPAAVLARRPDALVHARYVVVGAILLAILVLLPVLQRSVAALVPPSEVLGPGLDPGGLATGLIQAALMVFGWLGIAIGLDRLHQGARPNPSAGIVVAGVAIVATVLSAAVFLPSYLASTAGPDPASLIVYLVSEAATLAVAYAAWVVVGGAGLAPRAGTLLGAVALVLVVTASVVLAIASLVFAVADGETALGAGIPWMTTASLLGAAGNVGLVGAFLLGLADPAVGEAEA